EISDLAETPTKITSGFQKLYLDDAKIYVPNKYDNYTFSLLLGDTKIFSQKIAVEKGPIIKEVSPTNTAITYPTNFKVTIIGGYDNITSYSWDFGDGTKQNATTNTIEHAYDTLGIYELKVIVTDLKGRNSFKKINVEVKSASEMVPTLFIKLKENFNNINAQMISKNFSKFEQKSINSSLGLDEMNAFFAIIETNISKANTEVQFEEILGQIIELNLPESLEKTVSGNKLVFYSKGDNIDLATLKEIGGGDYSLGNEEDYKNAVIAWEMANVKTNLTFSEISAVFEGYTIPFLKTFEMDIKNTNDVSYLVIKNMENLIFLEDYNEQVVGDYVYIQLNDSKETISFSATDENFDFANLPVFISPSIKELVIIEGENISPFEEGKMVLTNPGLFFTLVAIVIISALIIWIMLQIWYVKRYEDYLFKNKNNLYNVVNYIDASKKNGLNEKEIAVKLRKSGWSSEQLQYALKKYNGKKTWFQRTFVDSKKIHSNNPQGNTQIRPN
ncbi:MAG: PKD domain-containing protein, partial [Nanoarchaeota archaeon]